MNKVAVIILNWNGEKLLREFLPSVIATTDPTIADVIVADNGSTDSSVELLRNEFPQVKVLEFTENYGFAEGYNRAIKETNYPYTILLNSDVATTEGWVNPLYDYMEANPNVGACQPKSEPTPTNLTLSMQVQQVDLSIAMATPIVEDVSLTALKRTKVNTTK